ncbi:hypothetical protein BO83DRAFT_385515 [Aspergillus eucalypticola CBS 122712]|uniref:Ankyrin n=1 Tax=Aspergillus eucalypticola (strain CBS 122712 / IBT 29274) TaxID=1448314 RepID=A0A317W3M0_ASPEC|nr:uncharacterized protein BO83DRAFT_385515 [Aspergillus eucalypticola CBS 122712]PWY81093.1 hypothetical protein BO83DRAFT_385515 [Aspergillus eucalypticola CBS 122712]
MTLFHYHPEKEITILHLLATSKLWSQSRLKADTDGDTPLHYACVAFGGHNEEKIPLDMFTDSAIANGNTKQKNNLGLTPLEARFWSFVDGHLNCQGTSDVLCIDFLTSESMERYTAPPPAENSVIKQRLMGEHAEQAWWELEKTAEVLWKWDAKKRSMLQSMYGNICGVKFSPTRNTFFTGLRTELKVDMEPSRRILDIRD